MKAGAIRKLESIATIDGAKPQDHVRMWGRLLASLPALVGVFSAADGYAGEPVASVGLGAGRVSQVMDSGSDCTGIDIDVRTDGSYENGFAWQNSGVVAPAYGAFAECIEGSAGAACGAVFDFTRLAGQSGGTMDVYVWGDAGGTPGAVLSITTGVSPGTVGLWPNISRHIVDIPDVPSGSQYWLGFWGAWPGALAHWYVGADLNGAGGCPVTNYAPGIGFPTGWQDVALAWGPTQGLGIGVSRAPDELYFAGLLHTATGQAHLTHTDSTLVVSNIGSSGADGVTIEAGTTEGLVVDMIGTEWYEDAEVSMTMKGHVQGGSGETTVGSVRLVSDAAGIDLIPAFPALGSTSFTVEAYRQGVLVARETHLTGSVARVEPDLLRFITVFVSRWGITIWNRGSVTNFSWFDIWMMESSINVGGSTTNADHVRIIPENVATPLVDVTEASFLARDFPSLTISNETVRLLDANHEALGAATLVSGGDHLSVTNIGSSGQDGVAVHWEDDPSGRCPTCPQSVSLQWDRIDPSGVAPEGASIQFGATGRVGGVSGEDLGTMTITRVGPTAAAGSEIVVDYSAVGSTTHQIEVYDEGLLVDVITGHSGTVAAVYCTAGEAWDPEPIGCDKGLAFIGGQPTACFFPEWPENVTFAIPGGPILEGDAMRVLAENPDAPFQALESFQIRLADYPSITLTAESGAVPADTEPSSPSSPSSLTMQISGNPLVSGAHSTIGFAVPSAGPVKLAVYDVSGRDIVTLIDGPMEAGAHDVVWGGRDAMGRDVAPGVYFARLSSGSMTAQGRFTVIR